jgi:hypothetical protein
MIVSLVVWTFTPFLAADEPPSGQALGPKLYLLDGQMVQAQSLTVADGKVTGEGVPAGLALDDLRKIEFSPVKTGAADQDAPEKNAAEKNPVAIDLFGGGELRGQAIVIFDDKCSLDWSLSERVSLPIDAIRAIRFVAETLPADFAKALAMPLADQDQIFLREGEKAIRVVGLIESLSEKELAFELDDQRRTIPRDKLLAAVMAQAQAGDPRTSATVSLANGSTASGELASLAGASLVLNLPSGAELVLPTAAVNAIALRSSRVEFLSDLKPVAAIEQPIVTLGRAWQKNRSVAGRPLTLAGRIFESGLGVHARSQLTFANEGGFDVLAGVIGIDAETNGRGDCTFVVLGDGQPLYTQRMTGADPPRDLRVEIGGHKQVTLLVEPGEDLDLADHADWCDIRFIKNRP